jgi:hypothetical protein
MPEGKELLRSAGDMSQEHRSHFDRPPTGQPEHQN